MDLTRKQMKESEEERNKEIKNAKQRKNERKNTAHGFLFVLVSEYWLAKYCTQMV
jgi:hypothetical protein